MRDLQEHIQKVRQGASLRSLARLITAVENDETAAATAVAGLYDCTGRAHIVGITGPPGAGKSSLVTGLAQELHGRGVRLAIVAVDPSSPFTGGALLGDRVRMRDLTGTGVFIRSMASRGRVGGLAKTTASVVKLLDAYGFELIMVETVGAGQAEIEIANTAHTTLVIEAPGMGDDVQSIKAGILEIADILVVNKADRPGARQTVKSLEMMLHMGPMGGTRHHGRVIETPAIMAQKAADEQAWQVPVQETVAIEKKGVPALVDKIRAHYDHLHATGQWQQRERARSQRELDGLLRDQFMAQFEQAVPTAEREAIITAVAAREMDPYTAVGLLLEKWTN